MQRWTPAEEAKLAEMAHDGLSAAICARALERSKAAVYSKAGEIGIQFTRLGADAETALWNEVPLVRDQAGQLVSWSPAHRSGGLYAHAPACERLLTLGMLKRLHGSTYLGA